MCRKAGQVRLGGELAVVGEGMSQGGQDQVSADSIPRGHLVDMSQQVGRIVVDAERAGAFQFVLAVAAGEQAYAQSASALGRQHVPDTVPDDQGVVNVHAKSLGGGKE